MIADNGNRITHRVVNADAGAGNSVSLVLKGDANTEPDLIAYVVTDVERVLADVPYLGYAVAWSSTPLPARRASSWRSGCSSRCSDPTGADATARSAPGGRSA